LGVNVLASEMVAAFAKVSIVSYAYFVEETTACSGAQPQR
jgi:hypothetical protein